MVVTYLFSMVDDSWKKGLEELVAALDELKIRVEINLIEIYDEKDAKKYDFIGSPTIRIDNSELDRQAWEFEKSGTTMKDVKPSVCCRNYNFEGKTYSYPPKEMIKEMLKTFAIWKETDKASDFE